MDAASSKIHFVIAGAKQTAISLHASDAISACFTTRILFLTEPGTNPGAFLGSQASCQAIDSDDGAHYWAGIITQVEEKGLNAKNKLRIEITLRPRLWSLSLQTDHRVIRGMSAVELVNATLARHNIDQADIQWQLNRLYPMLPYTVQYKETDLAFIQRLLSDNGISYWFDCENGQDIVRFTDHNSHFPYVDLGAIPLIPPTGTESGSKRAQACFHRFGKTSGARPRRTALHDWHDMTPQVRLLAGDIPGKDSNDTDVIYGSGQTQIEAASIRAETENERNAVAADQYLLDGSVASLAPGMAFSFKHPDLTRYSGDYLVVEMSHKIIQRAGAEIEGDGTDLSYTNSVKLISREKPYRPPAASKPVLPTVYTARVENDGDYALLDERGRLRLRNVFDLEPSRPTQATPFIRKAQSYGGGPGEGGTATGLHLPLTGGTEVLWGSIDGDPDRPVILGTLPNPETPSPINSDNPAQNRLRTASDNEWLLDDTTGQERIELKQGDVDEPFNLFRLDANNEGHKIRLACTYGALAVYAKKTMLVDAGDTITQKHGNDRTEIVENESNLATKNKDIYAQAATDHVHTAKKNIKHTAKENIEQRAEKITTWRAQKNARLTIKQGDQIISVENSSLVIQSPNKLAITGKGGGSIKIGQNGGGLEIDSGGNVKLYGKKVTLNGASGTTFNGNTSYDIGGAPSLNAGPLAALDPGELPWIETESKTPDTHNLELSLTDEFIETLPKHLDLMDGAKYTLTTDLGETRQGTIEDRKIDEKDIIIANTFDLAFEEKGGGSQPDVIGKPKVFVPKKIHQNFTSLKWSQERFKPGQEVKQLFKAKECAAGDKATLTVYEIDDNGQQQEVESKSITLTQGPGNYAFPWSRSVDDAEKDLDQDIKSGDEGALKYVFEVAMADGAPASSPLLLMPATYELKICDGPEADSACYPNEKFKLKRDGKVIREGKTDENGTAFIRCTNPNAKYMLEILDNEIELDVSDLQAVD